MNKAFYYSKNNTYQTLANIVNLHFYYDFTFAKNLNAGQQVVKKIVVERSTRERFFKKQPHV